MNLIELQNKIHQQNKELGWWDEPRPFSTFVCLFHSELSEAMEGDRKGLNDDHLPQYPMFWVELADFAIRCLDWLGSMNSDEFGCAVCDGKFERETNTSILSRLHCTISKATTKNQEPDQLAAFTISVAVEYCIEYAKFKGVNLLEIILEKVEYNRTRADHKRENRQGLPGQKKY